MRKEKFIFCIMIGALLIAAVGCTQIQPAAEDPPRESFIDQARAASSAEEKAELYAKAIEEDPTNEELIREFLGAAEDNAKKEELLNLLDSMELSTPEDYMALYELYSAEGRKTEALDVIEKAYILTKDSRFSEMLTVYEAEALPGAALFDELKSYLSAADAAAAVELVTSEAWQTACATRIPGDKRVVSDGLKVLCTQDMTKAWLLEGGDFRYLSVSDEGILFGAAGHDGGFNGPFSVKYCTAASGDVYEEAGAFENGICTGEITSRVLWGDPEEQDVFALFQADMSGAEEYTGEFEAGVPKKPEMKKTREEVPADAYAFNSGKTQYIRLADTEVFSAQEFGFEESPEW